MAIWSALSGAASGGGLLPGIASFFGAKAEEANTAKANAWAAGEAQKNRDFQERMSSSAHQRAVQDLQAAGLNPILAAGGPGASSPGGATAQSFQADPAGAGQKAASSAIDAMRTKKEMEATTQAISTARAQEDLAHDQAFKVVAERRGQDLLNKRIEAELPAVSAEAEARRRKALIDSKLTTFDAGLNRSGKVAEAVGNVLGIPMKALQGLKNSSRSIERTLTPSGSPSRYRPGSAQNIFGEIE